MLQQTKMILDCLYRSQANLVDVANYAPVVIGRPLDHLNLLVKADDFADRCFQIFLHLGNDFWSCSNFFSSSNKALVVASSSFLRRARLIFSRSISPTMVGWEFTSTSILASYYSPWIGWIPFSGSVLLEQHDQIGVVELGKHQADAPL